jgi:hypothetical protein
LGLRPWFALLRRARSLRRFAFAMAGSVPAPVRYRPLPAVAVISGDWRVEGVVVAATFRQRLAGVHAAGVTGLLLHAGTVHGIGLVEPLRVIHLTASGTVVGHELLGAGGLVRARSHWLLEVPPVTPPPPIGARLTVLPSSPG